MSAQLSRRLGRVALLEPLISMPMAERVELNRLAVLAREFGDLPGHYQHLILAAEEYWSRAGPKRETRHSA